MLHLTKVRELTLQAGSSSVRPPFLSAASGLVRAGNQLYVVADDEVHLGVFNLNQDSPGELLRVFPGELPDKPKRRKKRKPDLEVLTRLPAFGKCPHGALLALGSGSAHNRCVGALLPLSARGVVQGALHILDAAALMAELAQQFADLNLEGAWTFGDHFYLLQRGNKGASPNAIIQYDLQHWLSALMQGDTLPALQSQSIRTLQLGDIAGVPLCFSDACVLADGRWLFTAVAEDTDDAYLDGLCMGAAIGMADANHQVLWIKQVTPEYKIEGIEVQQQGDALQLLLVSDADDPEVPACLLSTTLR